MKYSVGIQITGEHIYFQTAKESGSGKIFYSEPEKLSCKVVNFNDKESLLSIRKNLKILYQKHKRILRKSEIIVTLPDNLTFLNSEYIPSNTPDENLDSAIQLNVSMDTPFEKDNSLIHWQEIPNIRGGKDKKEFLISITPKKVVENLLNVFTSEGIIPYVFEVYSFSHLRAVHSDKDYIGVIYKDQQLTIYIFEKKGIRFIDYKILQNKNDLLEFIFIEIIKVINFYSSDKKKIDLNNFYIDIGNGKDKETIVKKISEKLSSGINLLKTDVKTNNLILTGAVLRGLKEKKKDLEISILPLGVKEKYELERSYFLYNLFGNIIIFTGLFMFTALSGFFLFLSNTRSSISTSITLNSSKPNAAYSELEKKAKEFNDQVSRMKSLELSSKNNYGVISLVKEHLPNNINLTKVSIDFLKETIKIEGISSSRDSVIIFRDKLSESPYFYEVVLPLSSLERKENTQFSITIKIKNE